MPAGRWLREPLLHFVLAGAVLFGLFTALRGDNGSGADATTIVVDRRNLLTFLQYRANAFEEKTFGTALDSMSDDELESVIDAYVDEEVLYREAKALGLEESDNVIRQRMVQKMRFLMEDVAASGREPGDAELEAYFEKNIEAYAIEPWATFTHVFFDAQKRGPEGARAAAEKAARELNASGAQFNDATGMGDRFPFLRNYVERTFEYVASHFGNEFADALQQLDPSETHWVGPIHSVYGEHVVLLTRREARTYPTLDEVRERVEQDYANERANEALDALTRKVRDRYHVEIGDIRKADEP